LVSAFNRNFSHPNLQVIKQIKSLVSNKYKNLCFMWQKSHRYDFYIFTHRSQFTNITVKNFPLKIYNCCSQTNISVKGLYLKKKGNLFAKISLSLIFNWQSLKIDSIFYLIPNKSNKKWKLWTCACFVVVKNKLIESYSFHCSNSQTPNLLLSNSSFLPIHE